MQVARDLNASGRFFALYNDLTRCLGVGDVTVVPIDGAWASPLSMELKSTWADESKMLAEIDFLSPHSDRPDFAELFEAVRDCLGLKDREESSLNKRAQRQVDELLERTDLLFRMQARLTGRLDPPGANHWRKVEEVLSRAYTVGSSFDIPEPNITYFAVRLHENEDALGDLRRTIERVLAQLPDENAGQAVSSADLAQHPKLSPFVPPIPLWPIPGDLRNALLAGRLFFGVRMSDQLWTEAFEAEGIDLEVRDREWHVSKGTAQGRLDNLEVWKLELGVALAGVSPVAVAMSVREVFETDEST